MNKEFAGDPHLLFNQAVSFHQDGQMAEAERLYRQLIIIQPEVAGPLHMFGVLRLQQGRNAEALELIGRALKINPGDINARADFAYALKRLGRLAEAVANFDLVLAIKPKFVGALHYRAQLLQELKHFESALAGYDQALALQPNLFECLYNRSILLWEMKRNEEALASVEKAIAIQPEYAEAWNNRGNVLRNLKRHSDALESFEKALAIKPDLLSAIYNRANVLFQDLKRAEEAISAYDKVLAINPSFAEAWNNRGAAFSMLERFAEALTSIDKALAIRPDFPEAMNCRGLVLFADDRIDDGIATFMASAALAYGAEQSPLASCQRSPPFKLRHDRDQHDYLVSNRGRFLTKAGARVAGHAVSLANTGATEQWRTKKPQIVVIDDLLTADALQGLRRFCQEAPIWRAAHDNGYLGAFPEHGFACPLLGQIAQELREVFPAIFSAHTLRYMWGFKFDSRLLGVKIHADEAAINVNFWLTPDEANLDALSGGLVVWDVAAPIDADFPVFKGDIAATCDYLANAGAKSVTVPYRANRAVIFDSDLFHETDKIHFKDGYLDRRINVAMLFGRRERGRP